MLTWWLLRCLYNPEGWYIESADEKVALLLAAFGAQSALCLQHKCLAKSYVTKNQLKGALTDCSLGKGSCKGVELAGRTWNQWDFGKLVLA